VHNESLYASTRLTEFGGINITNEVTLIVISNTTLFLHWTCLAPEPNLSKILCPGSRCRILYLQRPTRPLQRMRKWTRLRRLATTVMIGRQVTRMLQWRRPEPSQLPRTRLPSKTYPRRQRNRMMIPRRTRSNWTTCSQMTIPTRSSRARVNRVNQHHPRALPMLHHLQCKPRATLQARCLANWVKTCPNGTSGI
jgi:hypothetical protein